MEQSTGGVKNNDSLIAGALFDFIHHVTEAEKDNPHETSRALTLVAHLNDWAEKHGVDLHTASIQNWNKL